MTIDPTNSAAASAPANSVFGAKAGAETFLQLLVVQIQNQDPLNPQDPTQFVSQLAEFSSLEQLIQMKDSLGVIAGAAVAPAPAAPEANG